MLTTIQTVDWQTVLHLVTYAQNHLWFDRCAYFCANILVLFLVPLLYLLWHLPQPASKHMGNKKVVMLALVSLIFAIALKTFIAMIYFRARPFVTHPELLVSGNYLDLESFPSGHALVAATVAASLYFSGMKRLGIGLFVLALFVAFGRVAIGVHYPTDVLAGLGFGVITAWVLHHESNSIKRYLPNA